MPGSKEIKKQNLKTSFSIVKLVLTTELLCTSSNAEKTQVQRLAHIYIEYNNYGKNRMEWKNMLCEQNSRNIINTLNIMMSLKLAELVKIGSTSAWPDYTPTDCLNNMLVTFDLRTAHLSGFDIWVVFPVNWTLFQLTQNQTFMIKQKDTNYKIMHDNTWV